MLLIGSASYRASGLFASNFDIRLFHHLHDAATMAAFAEVVQVEAAVTLPVEAIAVRLAITLKFETFLSIVYPVTAGVVAATDHDIPATVNPPVVCVNEEVEADVAAVAMPLPTFGVVEIKLASSTL